MIFFEYVQPAEPLMWQGSSWDTIYRTVATNLHKVMSSKDSLGYFFCDDAEINIDIPSHVVFLVISLLSFSGEVIDLGEIEKMIDRIQECFATSLHRLYQVLLECVEL